MTTTDTPEGFDWLNPSVVRLIERYTQLNRKAIPQDAEQSRVVREVAEFYAANYEGNFLFMCEMRAALERWHKLSTGQAAATINCLMNEYRRRVKYAADRQLENVAVDVSDYEPRGFVFPTAQLPDLATEQRDVDAKVRLDRQAAKEAAPASAEPITQVVRNGTYTIVLNEAGDYRTIKLMDTVNPMRPRGTQVAAYLRGPDNDQDFTIFAYVHGATFDQDDMRFKKESALTQALVTLLRANPETRAEYGYAYAVESGRCYRCNRKLTVPASISMGLGPDCAKK